MIFPSQEQWMGYNITESAHKFFVLRWQELFNDETFDSWQVRTSSLKTILQEMKLAVDIVGRVHAHHTNIEYLISEAEEIVKRDLILKRSFPFASDYLVLLKKSYEDNVKKQQSLDLPEFLRIVNVITGNLANYSNEAFKAIYTILSNPPPKNFQKDLYSMSLFLGVDLIAEGYSILALKESLEILLAPETSFIERYDKLKDTLNRKVMDYECHFLIKCPKDMRDIGGFDINLKSDRPEEGLSQSEQEFYDWNREGAILAITKTKAKDVFSARYLGEKQIEDLFAVGKLYLKNREASMHDKVLVKPGVAASVIVETDLTGLGYIKDPKMPRKRINEFVAVRQQLSSTDADQLNASLQFHKLATLAPTDESRLVNLWIALESLVQDGGTSIIGRICRYIPKSCSTRYIQRKVTAFAIDSKELWKQSDTSTILPLLTESQKGHLHYRDILRILLDKSPGPLIDGFAGVASQNELLVFRLSKLFDEFSTPENLAATLERNIQGVTWQLRRIYRTRNHITHKGISQNGIRQLIQHLNSYYITAYFNLIYDLYHNPCWTISDAFEHRMMMHEYVIGRLKNYKEKPLSFDMLLNMSLALTETCKDGAWKAKTEKVEAPTLQP